MARLGDYIEQIRGVSYKPEDVCSSTDNDAVAILRANNIQDDGLNFDDLVYVKKSKILDKQYIQKGDIIVCASSGSKSLVGKAAIASEKFPVAFGAFCKVVRPKKLIPSYIGYFFQSPKYRSTISELSGGANINNIRNEHIDELGIVIVSEKEQESIVNQLDVLSNLIFNRKQQLSKLDELVKSRFIELTEATNTLPTRMGDIATYINGYAFKPAQWEDSGHPIIRIQNLNNENAPYNYYSGKLPDKYLVHNGDVLVSWATHLEAYIWKGKEAWLNQHIFKVVFDKIEVDKTYFVYACEEALRQAFRNAHGFKPTMEHIKKADFDTAIVRLPDSQTQKKFATFVEQVDKSKSEIQKSLEKLETLKKALMQKYFG